MNIQRAGRRFMEVLIPGQLVARERRKYKRIWELFEYRQNHDCEHQASRFIEAVGIPRGTSVTDVGCGPGYATKVFLQHGMTVTAIDIAENAIDDSVRSAVTFICGSIWNLKRLPTTDYGFCTDVMEHIPPGQVDRTLQTIRRTTRHEVFFDISLRKDGFGARIGETLHLTVRPLEWWTAELRKHWATVNHVSTNEHDQSASWIVA